MMKLNKEVIKISKSFALVAFLFVIPYSCNSGQSVWQSKTWSSAINLTEVMSNKGVTEASGLHWNPVLKRLYVVRDNGNMHILQLNKSNNTFSQIALIPSLGGPEGIMQVDYKANEFYTIDEKRYEIRRYKHSADFQTVTLANKWNLQDSPCQMPDTGNDGCEGIEFVPDKYLKAVGFISTETDKKYISTKGMGGLIFIAHQKKGYVWVFDVNPDKDGDYAFVGRYKTNRNESCDLAFDRSTGLMYILHNTDENSIEVTDLSINSGSGKPKFALKAEYKIPNPDQNVNIEGFAITPKFADPTHVSVWLCRDVDNNEDRSIKEDCIRWFTPFKTDGTCFRNWEKE